MRQQLEGPRERLHRMGTEEVESWGKADGLLSGEGTGRDRTPPHERPVRTGLGGVCVQEKFKDFEQK